MTNDQMCRTFGDGLIHESHIDALVECNGFPLHLRHTSTITEIEQKIGQIIADNLVDNGATLQMGMFWFSLVH